MRTVMAIGLGVSIAASGFAARAEAVFSYRGKMLLPQSGSGVPGVKYLHFKLSGSLPAKGACSKDLTVLEIADGAYSMKKLLALGFTATPGNRAEICSDATTGALSERLRVQLILQSDGDLIASYAWESDDPKRGKTADTVKLFANVEYHVSAA